MSNKISLVLSAGGIRAVGAALGTWSLLQPYLKKNHWPISEIVACSGGSIVAPAIAMGKPAEAILAMLQKFSNRKLFADYAANPLHGLISGRRLEESLKEMYDHRLIEQLPTPLTIVAARIMSRGYEQILFHHGPIAEAVRATIAIPGFIKPKRIGHHLYADGGLVNPVPADIAIDHDATKIYVIAVRNNRPNLLEALSLKISRELFFASERHWRKLDWLHPEVEVIPIVTQSFAKISPWETQKLPLVMAEARQAALIMLG